MRVHVASGLVSSGSELNTSAVEGVSRRGCVVILMSSEYKDCLVLHLCFLHLDSESKKRGRIVQKKSYIF